MVEVTDLDKLNGILKEYGQMVLLTHYEGTSRELRLTYEAGSGPEENVSATVVFDEAVNISLPSVFHNSYITYKEITSYSVAKSIIGDQDFADDEEFPAYYKLYLVLKNDIESPYYVLAHGIKGIFKGPDYKKAEGSALDMGQR